MPLAGVMFCCPYLHFISPLSHALKKKPVRGQDGHCIFCDIERVVFHSTFSSLLTCNVQLCWGSFEDFSKNQLQNSSTPANNY